jgi:hypothetical protein
MATYSGQVLSSSIRRLESNPKGLMVSATGTATRISPAAANHLSCWRSTPSGTAEPQRQRQGGRRQGGQEQLEADLAEGLDQPAQRPTVTPTGLFRNGNSCSDPG